MLLGVNCMETFTSATSRDLKKKPNPQRKCFGNNSSTFFFYFENELTKYATFNIKIHIFDGLDKQLTIHSIHFALFFWGARVLNQQKT